MGELWKLCWAGARANLWPGVALQIFAGVLVGAYYFVPAARPAYLWIGELKSNYSYLYSAAATCIFGGLIPFLYLLTVGRYKRTQWLGVGLFFLVFWTWKGIEVDFLYRMQAALFGESSEAWVVAKKVVFDQFVYCPIWSAPAMALAYRWKDSGFSWKCFKASLDRRLFAVEIPAILFSMWIVWIPGTAFIYSMPAPLQLPLFNLVLCFFVLLVSALGESKEEPEASLVAMSEAEE